MTVETWWPADLDNKPVRDPNNSEKFIKSYWAENVALQAL